MKTSKELIFIADPWYVLDPEIETTLILGREAQRRGLKCYWVTTQMISVSEKGVFAHNPYILNKGCTKLLATKKLLNLEKTHSIHWRVDPPVTLHTMRLWSLLASALKVKMLNPPLSLLKWNEKYSTLRYRQWVDPTLVTENSAEQEKFARNQLVRYKKFIAKPAAEAASRGVQLIQSKNHWKSIQKLKGVNTDAPPVQLPWNQTPLGSFPILQKYNPNILRGETRFLIVGGKVMACIAKIPNPKYPVIEWEDKQRRPTMMETKPSAVQLTRMRKILQDLNKDGVHFATIDFIGDKLLEINVTSPGTLHALSPKTRERVLKQYFKRQN